jgi:hypothetical protein
MYKSPRVILTGCKGVNRAHCVFCVVVVWGGLGVGHRRGGGLRQINTCYKVLFTGKFF